MFRIWVALLAAIFVATPAHAKWREASSDHFVVYSQSRTDDVRHFAEMLEKFHVAMELEMQVRVPPPSPSNRVTVYMVASKKELRKLYGDTSSNVAGFYIPRASGSVAFVPQIRISSGEPDFALTVLLHEYAHHFLLSSSRHALPRWVVEGSAEYFASAKFHADGKVDIGLPNNNRAWELANASKVPLRQLLDHDLYSSRAGKSYSAFYGRSWLLFHYLRFTPERKGQFAQYLTALQKGEESLKAAEQAFGDLDKLEGDLRSYNKKRRMSGMRFEAKEIKVGNIETRELSEGHSAMMEVIIQSERGVNKEKAQNVIVSARQIASKYPSDPAVQAALAEAEYDAGNDAEAIAAADRAIAADPATKNAYVQKGYALFRQAMKADDKEITFEAAMKPFEKLNVLENDHPLPLIYYYRSFSKRGVRPPESAQAALERASQLAPFDHSLAMNVALMHAELGNIDIALILLKPIATNPHGKKRAAAAARLIELLEAAPRDKPFNTSGAMAQTLSDGAEDGRDDGEDDDNSSSQFGLQIQSLLSHH